VVFDRRANILISSIRKLTRRGAFQNVQKILAKAHTPDIASLIEETEAEERLTIFKMIAIDKRAQVLSYLNPATQSELILALDRKEANQLVSLMDSNDAADLLSHIPENISQEILGSMVKEDQEEVADLMQYPEDTAGSLMSPDYLALNSELTVSDAIREIQSKEDEFTAIYVYVIDDTGSLVGVMSLKDLIISKPTSLLREIMNTDIISAAVDVPAQEVAKIVERYDFLSIPIIDSGNKLVGIVTVDDVIDVIREEAQEDLLAMGRAGSAAEDSFRHHFTSRIPWLMLAFAGGIICYVFYDLVLPENQRESWWVLAGFIPLVLSLGSTAGSQSATVAVGAARLGQATFRGFFPHLLDEMVLAAAFAAVFGTLIYVVTRFAFGLDWAFFLMVTVVMQLFITVTIGSIIPLTLQKFKFDPAIISIPLFTICADISAMVIIFGLYSRISGGQL
jgi:magnesium transporter